MSEQTQTQKETQTEGKDKTDLFINDLALMSVTLQSNAITNAEKDFSISVEFTTALMNKTIASKNVKSIRLNKETNKLGMSIYNHYAYKVLGEVLDIDFPQVYAKVKEDFKMLFCFNSYIRKAITSYKSDLLKNL